MAAKTNKPSKPRLLEKYESEVLPAMAKEFERENRHALPRLEKVVVNMGVGSAISEKKHIDDAVACLTQITGQKPIVTIARKSIANFRLREGMPIGAKVTLRGLRMYEFMDRLISVTIPRVRDFRGLNPKGFDGNGNYSMGLTEQLVFAELNPDKFPRVQGMNITFVISGSNDDESRELLRMMGMPFKREEEPAGAA